MHRPASTCSSALRNVRIAISPLLIGAWSFSAPAKDSGIAGNIAVPIVAAPAAIPVFRKDRRFLEPLKTLPFSFIESPFHLSSSEAVEKPAKRRDRRSSDVNRLTQRGKQTPES